jgi:hypothetical protein
MKPENFALSTRGTLSPDSLRALRDLRANPAAKTFFPIVIIGACLLLLAYLVGCDALPIPPMNRDVDGPGFLACLLPISSFHFSLAQIPGNISAEQIGIWVIVAYCVTKGALAVRQVFFPTSVNVQNVTQRRDVHMLDDAMTKGECDTRHGELQRGVENLVSLRAAEMVKKISDEQSVKREKIHATISAVQQEVSSMGATLNGTREWIKTVDDRLTSLPDKIVANLKTARELQ